MNNTSPLIPQGSNLEQQSKARSSLKVKIFCALGVNVAVLLVLLMQGCKREQTPVAEDPNATTAVFTDTNEPAMGVDTNAAATATDTNVTSATTGAQPMTTTQPPITQ